MKIKAMVVAPLQAPWLNFRILKLEIVELNQREVKLFFRYTTPQYTSYNPAFWTTFSLLPDADMDRERNCPLEKHKYLV